MRQNYKIKVAAPIISKKIVEEKKGQKRGQICRWPWQNLHNFTPPALLERIVCSSP